MPISVPIETVRMSQMEFGKIAFDLMRHCFAIHDQFGRFFDEAIYQKELATRTSGALTEVPITISHREFTKQYFLDFLKDCGALFELKCVKRIDDRHRSQLLNYLLLTNLQHGKIVNFRPKSVEHEFVNCHQRLCDQRNPRVHFRTWRSNDPDLSLFAETLVDLVKDWGVGLDISLYHHALSKLLGGEHSIRVFGKRGEVGLQNMPTVTPEVAFAVTALSKHHDDYRVHLQKLLSQTSLRCLVWANLFKKEIVMDAIFKT